MNQREMDVFLARGAENFRVGRCWAHQRGARETLSFEYDAAWLQHGERFALEPALGLYPGVFHVPPGHALFGSLADSAPDRWGRTLMRRAEALRARAQKETPRTLTEVDFLLGVNDEIRQGALRFCDAGTNIFLAPSTRTSILPLVTLPRLLQAADRVCREEEQSEDIQLLLAPGSSLGGARPKASVRDREGHLFIAKFARPEDEFNVVLWEAVALSLAEKAGLNVPKWRVESVAGRSVLMVRRFDRQGAWRIPFLSAMSMLGAKDNEIHSYLEIAEALQRYGSQPVQDLKELFKRLVFNVLITNTDDHLRNHGFIYEWDRGWSLSPVYDINPIPAPVSSRFLSTTIDGQDASASLELALSAGTYFRLSPKQARAMVKQVVSATEHWRETARGLGLKKNEIERMASAFEHPEREWALKR